MMGFIEYKGTYRYQGTLIHWACSASDMIFEARHKEHPPTQDEVEDAATQRFNWSHLELSDHQDNKLDLWIKHFDGADPFVATFRFQIDKSSRH